MKKSLNHSNLAASILYPLLFSWIWTKQLYCTIGEDFGFAVAETQEFVQYHADASGNDGLKILLEMANFYNGYKLGKVQLFNPVSVYNYLCYHELKPFWVSTGSHDRSLKDVCGVALSLMDLWSMLQLKEAKVKKISDLSFLMSQKSCYFIMDIEQLRTVGKEA
jgi:hypothetical protein